MNTQESGRSRVCSCFRAPGIWRGGVGVLILRVGVAGMMLCHGWPKLLLLVQGRGGEWMDPLGWGAELSLALCVFAEFFCSLALLVGLMTRLAALVLVVNFWVVIFVYGEQSSWAQNELPLLYLLCFVSLVCLGGGPLSLDRWLARRLRRRPADAASRVTSSAVSARTGLS